MSSWQGGESKIKYIGIREPPFQQDLTVLDENEDIERLKVGVTVLVDKTRA